MTNMHLALAGQATSESRLASCLTCSLLVLLKRRRLYLGGGGVLPDRRARRYVTSPPPSPNDGPSDSRQLGLGFASIVV